MGKRPNKILKQLLSYLKSIILHDSNSPSNIFNPSAKRKRIHFKTNCNWPLEIN